VSAFIDGHRGRFGVEPICRVLGVSASADDHRATGARSARAVADERLLEIIRQTHKDSFEAYGYRKMWTTLLRAGETAPRCQGQRLMRQDRLRGAKRGGRPWRTTIADPGAEQRPGLINRDFTAVAPDRRWVGDFTYLRCWEGRCSSPL
jgi:putative transposase